MKAEGQAGGEIDLDNGQNPFFIIMIVARQSSVILTPVAHWESHGVGKAPGIGN